MSLLEIRAGTEAFARIKQEGLTKDMISTVVAAAGGPKWFTTYGLTRYIIADFLKGANHPIQFLGSSVGSWQMACGLSADPGLALDRLQDAYCNKLYSDQPDSTEISEACKEIIQAMLGGEMDDILGHSSRYLHIMTSRGKGLLSSRSRATKSLGFGYGYLMNMVSRSNLNRVVERVVFSTGDNLPYDRINDVLASTQVRLTSENLLSALRASGSIPFLMNGIYNISGSNQGAYWDGGITDYHIALPHNVKGLVLHPHFLPDVTQGWFDKKLPWKRLATQEQMSKVVLITPSRKFVSSLPRQQISDLKDLRFYGLDQQGRIDYWSEISRRSRELGDELKEVIESGSISEIIKPY